MNVHLNSHSDRLQDSHAYRLHPGATQQPDVFAQIRTSKAAWLKPFLRQFLNESVLKLLL